MPGMNGYEVAQDVRQRDGAGSIVLVALTGWGQPGDKARARQAGFDHHVTKPVDFEEVSGLLARVRVG
jgi:CheY-like chemotaxis protein